MITLTFEQFSGTPRALYEQVRKGKIAAKDLPVLALTEQALAQVEALGLSERSELLPLLAELVLYKLRAFAKRPQVVLAEDDPEESENAPAFLETLVALEEAIAFLEQRSRERARVLPVPPSPLPKDRRLRPMPLQLLVRAVEPFARRAELLLEPETFGLREAWERIKGYLWGVRRALFGRLPFRTWAEQTVAFAALLEAKKQGEVELLQAQNFGALEVELKSSS
ncbi:MAG: chromosome segregation protein ScpA [Meiothermus sp.]|uniref:chromosome segregation protein ScpA n=1 Tax=Meiothermus sp. TaxID=1955249 RepID=UPI0025CF140E|nr:chromosome segregation protein ScpA [Meiothermus sp.]MCS7068977.1 chromosome segregation protein ScpA [Meiothermus sp.]MCX7601979.1 chromosome segregation protein ScpA [Meiothermus sp.]MDW8424971.1 chromosome segregation protein ScpA [Meiothermus sp.]